jgi:hypothetical protein
VAGSAWYQHDGGVVSVCCRREVGELEAFYQREVGVRMRVYALSQHEGRHAGGVCSSVISAWYQREVGVCSALTYGEGVPASMGDGAHG